MSNHNEIFANAMLELGKLLQEEGGKLERGKYDKIFNKFVENQTKNLKSNGKLTDNQRKDILNRIMKQQDTIFEKYGKIDVYYEADGSFYEIKNYNTNGTTSIEDDSSEDEFDFTPANYLDEAQLSKCVGELKKILVVDNYTLESQLRVRVERNKDKKWFLSNFIFDLISLQEKAAQLASSETNISLEDEHTSPIHPNDVRNLAFLYGDKSLKQFLGYRLFKCKLAIPLLTPGIESSQKPLLHLDSVEDLTIVNSSANEIRLKDQNYPIISLIRMGDLTNSKSAYVNALINQLNPNLTNFKPFYTRDLLSGDKPKGFQKGGIDFSWNLIKDDKQIREGPPKIQTRSILMLNLHGDANDPTISESLDFILKISDVIICFVPKAQDFKIEHFERQFDWKNRCILVNEQDRKETFTTQPQFYTRFAAAMSLKQQNCNLPEYIKQLCDHMNTQFESIENSRWNFQHFEKVAREMNFRIDQDDDRQIYENIRNDLNQLIPLYSNSQENMPNDHSQRVMNEYYELFKKRYRITGNSTTTIGEETKRIQEQLKLKGDQTKKTLEPLEKMLLTLCNQFENTPSANFLNQRVRGLNSLASNENFADIKIESLIRRMAQYFEFNHSDGNRLDSISNAGMNLLRCNVALELLDGDTGTLYRGWLKAIFDKLNTRIPDAKIVVISVLGVESSGKSTLLNTLFGLRFRTSAGRCTKGAHMQLLELDQELSNKLNFTHVLIVDVEGLSSLSLGHNNVHHDNELATFIVSISDLTLINLMGENYADMEDKLEICITALVRMKEVQLEPSCVFVHQNVNAKTAQTGHKGSRERITSKMNEVLKLNSEIYGTPSTSFEEMFNFKPEEDIYYLTNHIAGEPPMSRPNPEYILEITRFKTRILQKLNGKGKSAIQIHQLINDVWRGVLAENFVFSFVNNREILVYREIESKFVEWHWNICTKIREIEANQHQIISNLTSNFELEDTSLNHLETQISSFKEAIKAEMELYFSQEPNLDIKKKYEQSFHARISADIIELLNALSHNLTTRLSYQKNLLAIKNKASQCERQFLEDCKKMAQQMTKENRFENQIDEKFEECWNNFEARELKDIKMAIAEPISSQELESKIQSIILQHLNRTDQVRLADLIAHYSKGGTLIIKDRDHIRFTTKEGILNDELIKNILELIRSCEKLVIEEMQKRESHSQGFSPLLITTMMDGVERFVKGRNDRFQDFKLSFDFIQELKVSITFKMKERIISNHQQFIEKHNVRPILEEKKSLYKLLFKRTMKGVEDYNVAIEMVCEALVSAILASLRDRYIEDISQELMKDNLFKGNKSRFVNLVMKNLASTDDCYKTMLSFVEDTQQSINKFVLAKVKESSDGLYKGILKKIIDSETKDIVNRMKSAYKSEGVISKNSVDLRIGTWLTSFCRAVEDLLTFPRDTLNHIPNADIKDINEFITRLTNQFEETKQKRLKVEDVEKHWNDIRETVYEKVRANIMLTKSGCSEQCPFCGAMCTSTIKDHEGDHTASYHFYDCLKGWHVHLTNEFALNCCTTILKTNKKFLTGHGNSDQSFEYKKYKTAGPPYSKWMIKISDLENSDEDNIFWKWFICAHKKQLEEEFTKEFVGDNTIPSEWSKITREMALTSLDSAH